MRYVKWGGPALPPGTHTTFTDATAPMEINGAIIGHGETKAFPGDLTPADQIINPDLYVSRGLGVYYEPEPPKKAAPAEKD